MVKRTNEENYVHINTHADPCTSWLGMQGGKQEIEFGALCSWGNLAHEFMHALGSNLVYIFSGCNFVNMISIIAITIIFLSLF